MNNEYYKSPKSSWILRQFWKAAGADRYLLERSTYSDQIKYFCLGGIVIATGVMAGLAGGYAIYTIFEPKGDALASMVTQDAIASGKSAKDFIHGPTMAMATIFGIIWGLIIYNIDRFIVTSTGKGDGTEAITKQEFKAALPRLLMGMIIALTISKPMEIRMFQSEINAKLEMEQDEYLKELNAKTDARMDEGKNIILLDRGKKASVRDSINTEIATQQKEIDEAWDMLNKQIRGEIAPFVPGCGGACEQEKARLKSEEAQLAKMEAKLQPKLDELNADIKKMDTELSAIEDERKLEKQRNISKKYSLDGLLERIKLAHEVAGFWVSLFITLLFMVIELTPIFFKMMLIKGPYDYMDENVRALARAEAGIEVEYNFYQDKKGLEKHKLTHHGAELKEKEKLQLIKAQEEINAKIIEEWKKKKLKDIEENPNRYISEE